MKNYPELAGAFDPDGIGCSKGDLAKIVQKRLGVKQTTSYRIVNQLIKDGKIRQPKRHSYWDVVAPELNPFMQEIADEWEKIPLEQYVEREYK